jgi:hypothetical protein
MVISGPQGPLIFCDAATCPALLGVAHYERISFRNPGVVGLQNDWLMTAILSYPTIMGPASQFLSWWATRVGAN